MRFVITVSKIPIGTSIQEWPLNEELFEEIGSNYEIEALSGQFSVQIIRDDQYLRLKLSINAVVRVPCDRCLKPIELPILANHEQIYALTDRYLPIPEASEFYLLGPREDRIDLTQAAYDYVCLALPSKRVRPSCPDESCPPYIRSLIQS